MLHLFPNNLSIFVLFGWLFANVSGNSTAQPIDFESQIAPVLEAKCLSCHNPNLQKGDFSMSTLGDIMAAGDDFLIPGNSANSMLHWITIPLDEGEPPEMPEEGEALSEEEAEHLAAWIDAGAIWPEGRVLKEASKADKSWWAYQPITDSELGSIDEYIESKLAEEGLKMNPETDRRSLIRRATYDLTGLPPTPEEVKAFVAKNDPQAYEQLIERLLESPHYGERWGRHWLDVVRFGESVGFEQNWIVENLWPFRDYVIQSINEDKPFDLFIREHLAGDVIGKGNPAIEIGSAFLVAGPHDTVNNQDAVQAAQIRANTLDEIINATGEAFLGMTLSCARCHDHKFDPIGQDDYYRMYATFAGVRHGSVTWAAPEAKQEKAALLKPLNQRKNQLNAELKSLETSVLKRSKKQLSEFESQWTRPSTNRTGTEEVFEPVVAKFVRLICQAQDLNLNSNTGFRLDEFEVWSSKEEPRNVALASNGGIARGKARKIEDFPNAYGIQHTNDGEIGARFIATSNSLTIELAEPTEINRVFFSSAQGEQVPDLFKFAFVAEYSIEVSTDGKNWREVAHGRDRKPVSKKQGNPARPNPVESPSHLDHRLLQLGITDEEKKIQRVLKRELSQIKRQISEVPALPTAWIGKRNQDEATGPFHIFLGGSPQKPGLEVAPASLSTLNHALSEYRLTSDSDEAIRRLKLAEWITHPDNPLTPRVLANRLWHYHFGTGIVDTPNDFGYMGGKPSHPELLDFLATELKHNHWQIKAMHRLIMLSKTYRQSSEWRDEGATIDADSRLLWRFPPRRLSAEEIRDTILQVAGNLDTTMGGSGFRLYHFMRDNVSTYEPLDKHGKETYRRAIYHQNARASVVDLMTDFDQADCTLSTPRRVHTTTPLQALTMLNHSFTLDMADSLAARVTLGHSVDPNDKVVQAFQFAYQRNPTRAEQQRSVILLKKHGMSALSRAILNSSELIYID